MTLKNNSKTILFASLIVAMVLPFSMVDYAEARSGENNISKLDRDIDRFVSQTDKFSNNYEKTAKINDKVEQKQKQLVSKYEKQLNNHLEKIMGDDFNSLSNSEKREIASYVVSDKFKEPMHEKFVSDMLSNEEGINVMGFEIIPPAYAACSIQPNVYKFKQLKMDIDGFEGDNELESVERNNLSSCLREYTLTFADEDHPLSYIRSLA